ncbi:MAG TPA: HD domain-containing phosphohydrolase [Candidatus Polarisedimenticolia bacterium]|nr:HD domain-containing phosphohydrolase [Candidatus Polarisedimenticolia bacterium]
MSNLSRTAQFYILAVYAAGLAAVTAAWALAPRPTSPWPLVIAIVVTASAAPFRIPLPVFGSVSIAFTFVFATLMLFGTLAAAVAAGAAAVTASAFRRRQRAPLYRLLFNAAVLALASVATGVVFHLTGGRPGAPDVALQWLPLLMSATTYFVVNSLLIAAAISLTDGIAFVKNWTANFLWTAPAYLAGAVLATSLTFGLQRFGPWIVLLAVPALYMLYFSLRLYAERLGQERRHGKQMADLYLSVIEAMALAIDAKDRTTQRHIRRVQTFAVELGRIMGLSEAEVEALKAGSLLHDIGKLAVPEHILCKPGKLTRDEFEKMSIHPRIGAEILETVHFPFPLASVVRSHHEKFDGTGYPDRLKGEEIPLAARILSVVDCFDALTSDRPYRKPLTKEEALKYVQSEAGTFYDPKVVQALTENLDRMEGLANQINRTRETWTAPDKRKASRDGDRYSRDTNDLRRSIMENISSAHRELYALYEIAQSIAKSLNLEEALGFMASKIAGLLHYRCLVLYLLEPERKVLKARFVHGHDAARLSDHEIRLGERMSGWAAVHRMPIHGQAHKEPVRREGARSDLEELLARGTIERLENAIVAPLLDGDGVLGVLALYDRPGQTYEEDHLRILSVIAKHVTSAVKNAILYEKTHASALTDPLTNLPNARYLFVSFEEEMSRAVRQQVPLSIIELDVNNFKDVNDRHGHPAGDRILRGLARAIRSQMRGCDTCVRYAGDEFIVTVPGVGRQGIGKVEGRIQRAIEAQKFTVQGGRSVRISVSMGSASFPEDGKSFDALIAVADARMYEVKFSRRPRPGGDPEGYQRFTGRRNVPVN